MVMLGIVAAVVGEIAYSPIGLGQDHYCCRRTDIGAGA